MRRPGSVFLALASVAVAIMASGSCSTAVTGPSFPLGAEVVPPAFTTLSVAGLPAACSGQVYYQGSTALCPAGLTYMLCDGISYTGSDCSDPGDGWTQETLSQYDRVGTAPSCDGDAGSPSGTVYVESSQVAPSQNAILVFQYCGGAMPSSVFGRFLTGGTGAADLNNSGILDADQQLVVNAAGTLLYAVNQGSDTIAAFHVVPGGLLTPVTGSPFPSGGMAPASLGISGNVLVVANKAADGIRNLTAIAPNYSTFLIQSDGSLKSSGSSYALSPRASPTQAYVAPGGKFVFGTEESGVLRGLTLSPTGELALAGAPVPLPDSLFPYGRPSPVWPAGLSASPTAQVLYTGIPNNNSIAALPFDDAGVLSLAGGESDPNASLPCWSVVNADGSRIYFANAGSDNVSVWSIADNPRKPTLMQTYELSGGGNPWGLRIDPTGKVLFVITPRQIHQVPEGQGQLLHGISIASDGSLVDVLNGSPVTIPVTPDTNVYGVTVVASH